MANGDIGFSWQPGATTQPNGGPGGQPGRGISPQQAVKILSLRIPERPSPRSITPQALLTSPGSAAAGAQGLDAAVAALMQVFRPQMQGSAPQVPSMPSMPELSQASSDPVSSLFSPPSPQPVQSAPRPSTPAPQPQVPQQVQPQASPFQNAGTASRRTFTDSAGGSGGMGGGIGGLGGGVMPRFIVERGPGGGQQDFHQSWDWGSFA